ncbi:hypothetical protein Q6A90_07405 [Aliarcobacter skirrowii]|uniref:hypothetical protein n=1 Tax=Aliarcobacter skirrowii TaxID=28200 RepID=UPI0029A82C4C|nr:hypothetical protein [Aliarcobacter skirrowii]MDX4062194.1 hypothetical protein [Aliarcobacter skirrowii]
MIIFKTVANRQLCEYSGSDKYINVTSEEIFNKIFDGILDGSITSINSTTVNVEAKGKTTNIHFTTVDKILNKEYDTFFAKGTRELRYQLTKYVHLEKIIPGDIISIFITENGSNYDISIKSESIYKYILERKSRADNRYRIMTEHPNGSNNAGIAPDEYTNEYLSKFGIKKLEETITFGKSPTEFTLYSSDNCNKTFIGVPYNTTLECDCFDKTEEII